MPIAWLWIETIQLSYRSNGKMVQARHGRLRAESSCSPCDNFDLKKGIDIAFLRLVKKIVAERIDNIIQRE